MNNTRNANYFDRLISLSNCIKTNLPAKAASELPGIRVDVSQTSSCIVLDFTRTANMEYDQFRSRVHAFMAGTVKHLSQKHLSKSSRCSSDDAPAKIKKVRNTKASVISWRIQI